MEEGDTLIQKQFLALNESPVCLIMDTATAAVSKELPIRVYESEVKVAPPFLLSKSLELSEYVFQIQDGVPQIHFLEVEYKIATLEAERIAVDHVAHTATSTASGERGASCK